MYILLLIWLFLILFGLILRKSNVLATIQLGFIAIMIAINNGNPDQWQYINLYNQLRGEPSTIFNGNIGLNIVIYISSFFNQYNLSIFLISCFFALIMFKAVRFYTPNISYVFSLYLISPFVIDTIQIKNFYATIIWLFFSRYLYLFIASRDRQDLFKYFLGVILASSIHFVFLFAGLFALVAFINEKNFFKFIFSCGLVLAVLSIIIYKIQAIILALSSTGIPMFDLLATKIQNYGANFAFESASARREVTIIFYIMIFAVMIMIKKLMDRDKNLLSKEMFLMVFLITSISVVIIPLMSYSQEIYRVQRNLLLLYYVMFAKCFDKNIFNFPKKKLDFGRFSIFTCSILVAMFYLYYDSLHWNYDAGFRVLFRMLGS